MNPAFVEIPLKLNDVPGYFRPWPDNLGVSAKLFSPESQGIESDAFKIRVVRDGARQSNALAPEETIRYFLRKPDTFDID